jgi:Zn finger protein HypA/HybF involved in hydrogenase expression
MKLEFWIIGITGFLVWNAYHEGKYIKMFLDNKKYFQMAGIGFAGLAFLLFMRKFPTDSQSMLLSASSLVGYLPLDKHTNKVVTPVLNMTKNFSRANEVGVKPMRETMTGMTRQQQSGFRKNARQAGMTDHMVNIVQQGSDIQRKQISRASNTRMKRSVSEAKKKYVAANQGWRCGHCSCMLDATYEIDHKLALMNGGTNDINNLEALCPNCHRKKTINERNGINRNTGGL